MSTLAKNDRAFVGLLHGVTFKVPDKQGRWHDCNYGLFLKLTRKKLGLTLPEVASMAGISKGTLSKIEHGGDFQISTLNKLSIPLDLLPTVHQCEQP